MTPFAIVIGEAFVDLIAHHQPDGRLGYWPRFGGSPLNVAVGIRRLGADVKLATTLAPDLFGHQLRTFFQLEGVDVDSLSTAVEKTVLSIATPRNGYVTYEYFGDLASVMDIKPLPHAMVDAASIIHASSTALNGGSVFDAVLDAFESSTAFKSMDPNPRPSLISDLNSYRRRLEILYPLVQLLRFSGDDMEYLYPDQSVAAAAYQVSTTFDVPVVVTFASKPTLLCFGGIEYRIPVPLVAVTDATGAGDSFMASVLADVWNGGPPRSPEGWMATIHRGNIAASLTCLGVGGAESMPNFLALDEAVRRA